MDRREFVAKTCMACASGGIIALLSSCTPGYYVSGTIEANGISVAAADFTVLQKDKQPIIRSFVIVHHEKLEFPIYLFRVSDSEYHALWMKCSHQGSELQAAGDHLYCSSHGSEYDKTGKVIQGPAEQPLRKFPVSVEGERILIGLS